MFAIETKDLTKYYGDSKGIENVSLQVKQGQVFGFIGPNGAGKSTMIRTILGLLQPTSGSAFILGMDTQKEGDELRKQIGYLPSEVNYYDEMTSKELLEYHCRFYQNDRSTEIGKLADYFELDIHKKIADLSFGNKKKCAIIQAIIHEPTLLILDEPTSGLDPLMQNRFFELLEELNEKGSTIFMSSHILSEIQRMCDQAAVIRNGEIIAIEDIQALLHKQMKKVKLTFHNRPDGLELLEGIQNQKWHGNKLVCEYVGASKPLVNWLNSLDQLLDITLEEPDLESIFMNYYKR